MRLLGTPNYSGRAWVWRQYDSQVMGDTAIVPGSDAGVVRVHGTEKAIAFTSDVTPRYCRADPERGGMQAVAEAYRNLSATGARPLAATDNLNFGNPEKPEVMGQFVGCVQGIGAACLALDMPIVSGNVSLYNETPEGPILPTPVVGSVGLLEDRSAAIPMRWSEGDEIWLLGEGAADPGALAGSELAWSRGWTGGAPSLDVPAAARLVALLPRLASEGLVAGLHDLSLGGLAVAAARMCIASGRGADLSVAAGAWPTAALFGERVGRVLAAVPPRAAAGLASTAEAAGVPATRLGVAGGEALRIEFGGDAALSVSVARLAATWESPL
jgi:phosphoribosylformylglycinamidine synthase